MRVHPNVGVVASFIVCHLHILVTSHFALHLPNRLQKKTFTRGVQNLQSADVIAAHLRRKDAQFPQT